MSEKIPNQLLELIKKGEKISTEFKEASIGLPNDLFETVCAFLNRNGGHIFLGVNNNGDINGVSEEHIEGMKKDFANLCNNPQKINPTVYLKINEYEIDNLKILHIYVHESSDVHKTKNKIFDRNEDGDYDITQNTTLVANMYLRKQKTYTENKIYQYVTINDLRKDLIERARQMAVNRAGNHIWETMTDLEMLKSASLYETNYETGEEGFTLAAILLLGKDQVIQSVLPHHKTDAILRVENIDRYDDRDDIRTNLIESYDRLVAFIRKHLSEKFYIENDQRINVRDKIAREICANILIHREYSNPFPAKLIIDRNYIKTENANKPRMIGCINITDYVPYPKNPKIAKFFKEIGFADELGSGVRNVTKYAKIYSGGIPTFKEDDIFKTEIPISNVKNKVPAINTGDKPAINADKTPINIEELIIQYLKENEYITNRIIKETYGIKDTKSKTVLRKLVTKNQIIPEGANKNRKYKLNK